MINYDPDKAAELDEETLEEGLRLGLTPVHIICDEANAKVGDPVGVSFYAFVEFVPRIGERIKLEDGTSCQVVMVIHKVSRAPDLKPIRLIPNVVAKRLIATEPDESDD